MSQVNHHAASGVGYWRSLEQLAETPEVRALVAKEFPGYDADSMASSSRRSFLKIMSAAMALAGLTLTGCRRWPQEKLAPFSSNPVGRMPGVTEQYATTYEIGGVGQGLLVTSYDGRPIKVEGNSVHPMSRVTSGLYGASTVFAQSSILDMYDPERQVIKDLSQGQVLMANGGQREPRDWEEFVEAIHEAIRANPAGFAVLSEATGSPSAIAMRAELSKKFPQVKWYEYEAVSRDNEIEGSKLAFGQAVRPLLHLDQADVVVCLDADPLGDHPAQLMYSRDWAKRRRGADDEKPGMNRVYAAESTFSGTGSVADVRVGVTPERVYAIAMGIATGLGVAGTNAGELSESEKRFVDSAVADIKAAGGKAVVTAGMYATPATHALAHAVNVKIGAVGTTVTLHEEPGTDRPTHIAAIKELAAAMNNGQVATLLIIGGNPVFDAPVDVNFEAGLAKVGFSAHLSLYDDETSRKCKWHLPKAHYLEAWGDGRSYDGTASIAQPLIEPLFGAKSTIELLGMIAEDSAKTGEAIVRRTWAGSLGNELAWRTALEQGVIPNTEAKSVTPSLKGGNYPAVQAAASGTFAVRLNYDFRVYDGRFANNGWLQETPDPLSKLVWDNAAMMSKKDVDALQLRHGDMITVKVPTGQSIEVPVFILPGHPAGVIGLTLGYGRTAAGPVGNELGFNTYTIRTTAAPDVILNASVTKGDKVYTLATTQEHHILGDPEDPRATEGEIVRIGVRGKSGKIIRDASLAEFAGNEEIFPKPRGYQLQLFQPPNPQNDTHAWGMSIDMSACVGCGACMLACQAENNIPIVGKTEVLRHREMNWLRVDRYFKGDPASDQVDVVHQVMLCQQCENAPCEQVCPVAATVHDSEGLNTMVYNRCIGTRYCSNNCPYKVRRFNYFDFHAKNPRERWGRPWLDIPDTQQLEQVDKVKRMQFNPDVTVRMRGVMEKCTYCVQRIHGATIAKRGQGTDVKDGDIITACQQSCPTEAIVFGDLNDANSRVSKLRRNRRTYEVLEELSPRTRTRYMAKLRNPTEGVGAAAGHKEA